MSADVTRKAKHPINDRLRVAVTDDDEKFGFYFVTFIARCFK